MHYLMIEGDTELPSGKVDVLAVLAYKAEMLYLSTFVVQGCIVFDWEQESTV